MKQEQRTIKNAFAEYALVHRRLLLALVVVCLLFSALLWQFYRLQIVNHEKYRTQSLENRVQLQRLAPKRGLIYDREQRLLAENQPSYMLVIYRDQVEDLGETISELQSIGIIDEQEAEAFYARMRNYRIFEAVPVRLTMDEESIAHFVARVWRFPGVEVKASLMRYYPQRQLITHMLGYISRINERERRTVDSENYAATEYIGKIGVERFYETELHGTVGFEYVEVNARGKVLRTLETTPPIPGQDVVLHLDLDLQKTAFDALGDYRGAIVAL